MATSYKAEVIADSTGTWNSNALRFPTERQALDYAENLSWRWMLVREWRATPSDDPPTHTFDAGRVIEIAKGEA